MAVTMIDGRPYKECARCKLMKHISLFGFYPYSADGYRSYCNGCEVKAKTKVNKKYDWSRAKRFRVMED